MIMAMTRARIAHWLYPGVKKPCSYTGKACPWSGAYRYPRDWLSRAITNQSNDYYIPQRMETTPFLRALFSGVYELNARELGELFHFVFLWEYYEETILGEYLTPYDIWRKVWKKCSFKDHQEIRIGGVRTSIQTIHEETDSLSHELEGMRKVDSQAHSLVKAALAGNCRKTTDTVSALLILAWWFRRGLFVGEKWDEALKKKCQILEHLNELLQTVIEGHHGRYPQAEDIPDGVAELLGLK